MKIHHIGAVAGAFVIALAVSDAAIAQPKQPPSQPKQQPQQVPQPSMTAIALAKEIITAKGGSQIYDPIIPSLIERAKGVFLQQNPMIGRDLNEVAARLRTELSLRTADLVNDAAKFYAASFTEQELKEVLAFYKSPLGRKVLSEEPEILEKSVRNIDSWGPKFVEEIMARFRTEMKKKGHEL